MESLQDAESAARSYLGSLLPGMDSIQGVREIRLVVRPLVPASVRRARLPHENPTNVHEFKPVYVPASDRRDVVIGYVVSPLALRHVRSAFAEWTSRGYSPLPPVIDASEPPTASAAELDDLVGNFMKRLSPGRLLLWAKYGSVLTFLRRRHLERLGVPEETLEELFVSVELQRLQAGMRAYEQRQALFRRCLGSDLAKEVLRAVPEAPVAVEGSFLRGQRFQLPEGEVTVINMPWGRDVASALGRAARRVSGESKSYMVTGVGCLSPGLEIDDIFMPSKVCVALDDQRVLNNKLLAKHVKVVAEAAGKSVASGSLRCVDSSLGQGKEFLDESYAAGVRAFDMESYGFYEALGSDGHPFHVVGHVMDLPLSGKPLGATYYTAEGLRTVLSIRSRGKNVCFEAIVRTIGEGRA